jgi:hypothetical protein
MTVIKSTVIELELKFVAKVVTMPLVRMGALKAPPGFVELEALTKVTPGGRVSASKTLAAAATLLVRVTV